LRVWHLRDIHSNSGESILYKATAFVAHVLIFCATSVFAADPTKMIIFPLDADPGEEMLGWLSEGIVMSLGEQLKSRNLNVFNRDERIQLVESVDLPPNGRLSRGSMIRVAQRAGADLLVMGRFSGIERNLKIALRVLDLKTLKLSGEITANGPVSALPQMENELAWLILSNVGLETSGTRERFQQRMRKIPNPSYAYFIQSFEVSNQSVQVDLLKEAVKSNRDFPEAHSRLGRIYFGQKNCKSAMPHLALARIEGSNNLENEFMKGTCYGLKDQPEQAIQSLSYVLSISRSFEALNNIGIVYLRKGESGLALNALLEARNMAHTDSTVLMNLAIAQLLQGSISSARGFVEGAIKLNPKDGMLQFFLGFLLKKQGESEQAMAAASKAKGLGINVDRLQTEDPRDWSRMIFNWKQ
jgi:tetratricopeptide (TPR) repeat protein